MAVKSKEEIINEIKAIIGDNTDDATIAVLEDINDSFESFSDAEDWKTKYEENDKAWRERYINRFYNTEEKEEVIESPGEEEKTYTYDELFKEEEKK